MTATTRTHPSRLPARTAGRRAAPGEHRLAVPTDTRAALARGWLWLALAALLGSGLFSILLVAARTPGLNRLFDSADFFRVALVVHVDLSVLVWFCAVAGMLWTLNGGTRALRLGWAALALCTAGTLAMGAAPYVDGAEPVMANYVPVLDGPVFLAALGLFGAGVVLLVLRGLWAARPVGAPPDGEAALRFGLNASVVATAVALIAFAWSWQAVPRGLDPKAYYEILFWGGGHALQFTWTLLMLVGWLWLAAACGARTPLTPRMTIVLFGLALASVFVTPLAYLMHDPATVEHRALHTWAMRIGGGLAIAPVALAVLIGLRGTGRGTTAVQENVAWRLRSTPAGGGLAKARPGGRVEQPLRAALLGALLLFGAGGVIGIFIAGSNVRVPAHYHGCIVGVTLALMGLVLLLLPRLGYAAPQGRLAVAQPWVYATGQLMHILGLVWSGGYGVQRKVAGSEQVLRSTSEVVGMGLMGLGGAVAIVGGLLFVVVLVRALRGR